jgi:hypothetical protein
VVTSATRAPLPSSNALVATVVPCMICAIAGTSSPARIACARPSAMPWL